MILCKNDAAGLTIYMSKLEDCLSSIVCLGKLEMKITTETSTLTLYLEPFNRL